MKRIQARTRTRTLHSTSFQPESHPVPRGPTDPAGSIIFGQRGKTLLDKGDTDKATHLALSGPGEAPATTDETSPLGRRWTIGLCKREGEREQARNEMIDELPEVEPNDVTCNRDLKEERMDEIPEDPSKKAAM